MSWLFVIPCTVAYRIPCHSIRVCSDSRRLSWWCSFNHLILCCPYLHEILPRIKGLFQADLTLASEWPKYRSFCVSPSMEYSRVDLQGLTSLISFAIQESFQAPQFGLYGINRRQMKSRAPLLMNTDGWLLIVTNPSWLYDLDLLGISTWHLKLSQGSIYAVVWKAVMHFLY